MRWAGRGRGRVAPGAVSVSHPPPTATRRTRHPKTSMRAGVDARRRSASGVRHLTKEGRMRVGVLGTGAVGKAIASKLVELGHEVTMGSRAADNPEALAWANAAGEQARAGTFAHAGANGELLFNCTAGDASLAAIGSVERSDLQGKVLVDVANPLDFSQGFPPTLSVSNTTSLAELIQRDYPELRVVKALNTMNNQVMVDPSRIGGESVVFMSGDDADAKREVVSLLGEFGWPEPSILDLGDITTARGPEMFLPLWVRILGALGTGDFNIAIVRR